MLLRFKNALDWPFNVSKKGHLSDPFGDFDGDGLQNLNDCNPIDPNKQDAKYSSQLSDKKFYVKPRPNPSHISTNNTRNSNYSSQRIPVRNVSTSNIKKSNIVSKRIPSRKITSVGYPKDKYGNKIYTPSQYKKLTTRKTPSGTRYSQSDRILVMKSPNKQTVIVPRPNWNISKGPSAARPINKTSMFVPAKALNNKYDRAYVGTQRKQVVNPYRPTTQNKEFKVIPRPIGWNTSSGPAYTTKQQPLSTNPFISPNVIRDENARAYVNEDRTMIINPYYVNPSSVNLPERRTIIRKR